MADETQFQGENLGLVPVGGVGKTTNLAKCTSVNQSSVALAVLVSTMERIDPFLRFLTKATGKATVPLAMLQSVLPKSASVESIKSKRAEDGIKTKDEEIIGKESNNNSNKVADEKTIELQQILLELTFRGVLNYNEKKQTVGFPLPPSSSTGSNSSTTSESANTNDENEASDHKLALIQKIQKPPSKFIGRGLHGSTEPTAKRRMKVLKWTLDQVPSWIGKAPDFSPDDSVDDNIETSGSKHPRAQRKRYGNCDKNKLDQCTEIDDSAVVDPDLTNAHNMENYNSDLDEVRSEDNKIAHSARIEEQTEAKSNNASERKAAYRALANLLRGYDPGSLEKHNISNSEESSKPASSGAGKNSNNDDSCGKRDKNMERQWLPCQASYAGSHAGRTVRYGSLSPDTLSTIPPQVLTLFGLDAMGEASKQNKNDSNGSRKLFLHQSQAIESAMNGIHTVVCTGTGSGKSLCFLLPVIAKALVSLQQSKINQNSGSAAVLLFPTKALAQDQYTKLSHLLESLQENYSGNTASPLRAGVIDGDTPHSQRDDIASECQIILTNPDTLHAAILPNWNKRPSFRSLLSRLKTIVIDEAHVYEGAFGAHVSMVLARLKRVCRVASSPSNTAVQDSDNTQYKLSLKSQKAQANPLFIACSATMIHPEKHFRLLCPIARDEEVKVLTSEEDGSACAPKHFFVWNPPILDVNGNSTGSVFLPKPTKNKAMDSNSNPIQSSPKLGDEISESGFVEISIESRKISRKRKRQYLNEGDDAVSLFNHSTHFTRRRHSADETAYLLAKAIATESVRCIAFCKTRMLVEWVYERCLAILKSDPKTLHLTSRVESYRGGYSADARRSIEDRLFKRELWGVVGTNALELGVDVGGIDLTLHCGYPGSLNSLLQQSGRAGRGKGSVTRSGECVPSCAVMVCFSSPSEQYLWRNPTSLLSRGVAAPPTLPINGSVVKGHILCAGEEFPLVGNRPVSCLLNEYGNTSGTISADCDLLGGEVYHEEVEYLLQKGLLTRKTVNAITQDEEKSMAAVYEIEVYSTHPIVKHPWQRVSLRSIEPVNYCIVDLSHPMQGGRTDKLYNQAAVMDSIPYSRVFYHAFPGAVIMHRGRKYRIDSMESPPPFVGGATFGPCSCSNLCAFARPTTVQYSTQALSLSQITVVKQLEHAELRSSCDKDEKIQNEAMKHQTNENGNDSDFFHADAEPAITPGSVAGSGVVTVKRTVHGYKKLSHVNRKELSRTQIVLPPMEFDTSAVWIDADSSHLRDVVNDFDSGVHALSHAMVAVAPVFVACTSSDLSCDCSRYECTRVMLYDLRAGGSGISAQLYGALIQCLEAAIELLEECPTCYLDKKYDGGCPGCLQSIPCDNFHQDLSRLAGVRIGKHLLERLKRSNLTECGINATVVEQDSAVRNKMTTNQGAKTHSMMSARRVEGLQSVVKPTNIIIGRASWMENNERDRWADVDDD